MSLRQLMQMRFYIPSYQRSYTWENGHVQALLDDFKDAVQRVNNHPGLQNQNHYLANFVLMTRLGMNNDKAIIDGQQRLITIIMILQTIALSFRDRNFPSNRNAIDDITALLWPTANQRNFILIPNPEANPEANPNSDINRVFLDQLLSNNKSPPNAINATQKNIATRFAYIRQLMPLKDDELVKLYRCILDSNVTRYDVSDKIEANRIFMTLNARGKPLTWFEKIKGLLIYYAEKAGNTNLVDDIYRDFEIILDCYENMDSIRVNEKPVVKLMTDGSFDMDTFLGWHYCLVKKLRQIISASAAYADIENRLKEKNNPNDWEEVINGYKDSAVIFFRNFHTIFNEITLNPKYYEAIVMCRLTGIVWPLVVACAHRQFLNQSINLPEKVISLFRLIQIVDKIHRRTRSEGQDLIGLAYDVYYNNGNEFSAAQEVASFIIKYDRKKWVQNGRSRSLLGHTLSVDIMKQGEGDDYLDYIFFDFAVSAKQRTVDYLRDYRRDNYQVAKVLRPYLGVRIRIDHGFQTEALFMEGTKSIGNYVLLTRKTIENIRIHEEINGPLNPIDLNRNFIQPQHLSLLQDTQLLFNTITQNTSINQNTIGRRTDTISDYIDMNWEIQ